MTISARGFQLEKPGAGASTSGRAKCARPPLDEAEADDEDGGSEGMGDYSNVGIGCGVGVLNLKSKK